MTVGERGLEGGITRDHSEPVIGEMKIADNFGSKHAGDVRSGGGVAARSDLFGDTASADNGAPFEDNRGVSGAGQIGGGGEAVVASANNDGVVDRVWKADHTTDRWSK